MSIKLFTPYGLRGKILESEGAKCMYPVFQARPWFRLWVSKVTLPHGCLQAPQARERARPLGFIVQFTSHRLSESLPVLTEGLFNFAGVPRMRKELWNYVLKLGPASNVYAATRFVSLQMGACHFQDALNFLRYTSVIRSAFTILPVKRHSLPSSEYRTVYPQNVYRNGTASSTDWPKRQMSPCL